MKCKLLRDATGPNPEFNIADREDAWAQGREYNIPREIVKPAGIIIEHPDAHLLCVHGPRNGAPMAEPADEECETRHARYLLGRENGLKRLRFMVANPPKDKKQAAAVMALGADYGIGRD